MGLPIESRQNTDLEHNFEVVIHISFEVRDFLRDNNYVVGSAIGDVDSFVGNVPERSWGILLPVDKPKPRRIFGITLPSGNPRRPFVGKIDLEVGDQSRDKDWLLSIYGRRNIERLRQLAADMSEKFDKKIGVVLAREEQDVEFRDDDLDR